MFLYYYLPVFILQTAGGVGEASQKEAAMLGLLESPSPNTYTYTAISANHHLIEHQFAR